MSIIEPRKSNTPVANNHYFYRPVNLNTRVDEAQQVDTVAMESTGVYWIPIYELLQARGFQVYLVNARHIKNVPGRKSDVQDCQWIQRLHSFGLLNASFRPDEEMVVLRAYLRQRAELIEHRAAHIQHMQKALTQMNLQLHHVVSDVTGVTGMKIVRDDDGAVGRAAAHFGTVGRNPRHDLACIHGGVGDNLSCKQHALSAKT